MRKVLFLGFFFLVSGIGYGASGPKLSQGEFVFETVGETFDSPTEEITPAFKPYRIRMRSCPSASHGSKFILTLDAEMQTGENQTALINRLLNINGDTRTSALEELITLHSAIYRGTFESDVHVDETWLNEGSAVIIPKLVEIVSCLDGSKKLSQFTADAPSANWFEVTGPEGQDVTDQIFGIMSVDFTVGFVKGKYDFLVAQRVDDEILEVCRTIMHTFVPGYESLGLPPPSESLAVYEDSVDKFIAAKMGRLRELAPDGREAFWIIVHFSQLCR